MNPFRALGAQLIRRTPIQLLLLGISASALDFLVLYSAARRENVLHIDGGVGLLQNFGLMSTLVGNAAVFYAAKKYYDFICSIRDSNALTDIAPIKEHLLTLNLMIESEGIYRLSQYRLMTIGLFAWLANLAFHVFGYAHRWAPKVFDSTDHPFSFTASRIHNVYTWIIIYPFLAHAVIYSSIQLWRGVTLAVREGVLTYDLLDPDQHGGFAFVHKAAIAFNGIVAIVYIQITLHIGTFKTNLEHVLAYIVLTVLLLVIDRMFLGDIYATLRKLRREALNAVKDKVYEKDNLSFEILKYCYDRRVSATSIANFALKTSAIVFSAVVKLWPYFSRIFSEASRS